MNPPPLMIFSFRTPQVAMNLTHQADPKEEKNQALLTLDRVLDQGVVLEQTHQ